MFKLMMDFIEQEDIDTFWSCFQKHGDTLTDDEVEQIKEKMLFLNTKLALENIELKQQVAELQELHDNLKKELGDE